MKKIMMLICICFMVLSSMAFGQDDVLEEPEIMTPVTGISIELENVYVSWNECENAEYYLMTLMDYTDHTKIIDRQLVESQFYMINKNQLKAEHSYEISVASVNGNEEKWISSVFITYGDDANISKPNIYASSEGFETPRKNLAIKWASRPNVDYYLIELINITDDKIVFDNLKETGSEYTISKTELEVGKLYKFVVTAVNGSLKDSDNVEFFVNDDGDGPEITNISNNDVLYSTDVRVMWNEVKDGDHYMVSLEDLTDNMNMISEVRISKLYYDIQSDDLRKGHEYKFSVASIVNDKPEWSHVYFSMKPPTLKYPSFRKLKNDIVLPYEDYKVNWEKTLYIDYYKIVLKDTTTGKKLINENVNKPYYTITKDLLSPGHTYEFTVITMRDEISRTKNVRFSVETIDLDLNAFSSPKSEYEINNVSFDWDDVFGTENYTVSIQDLDNNELVLDDFLTNYSSFKVSKNLLNINTHYKITVKAANLTSESVISHEFMIYADNISTDQISKWALPFVEKVYQTKVVSDDFLNHLVESPQEMLTRLEFCEMLLSLYENSESESKRTELQNTHMYEDISHLSIEAQNTINKASTLGIVSGTSDTSFDPDGNITRQMMAVMLKNTFDAIYVNDNTDAEIGWDKHFKDESKISKWAYEGVRFSNKMGILSGDGDNFNPNTYATHEMGLVLLDKAFNRFSIHQELLNSDTE